MKRTIACILPLCLAGIAYGTEQSAAVPAAEQQKSVATNEALNALEKRVAKLKFFSAHFKQEMKADKNKTKTDILGEFKLKQPGKFRWETSKPYKQIVVADGKAVYTYDPELEQALIQDLNSVIGDTPALLFSGDVKIGKFFNVSEKIKDSVKKYYYLVPKKNDSTLEKVSIEFTKDILSAMYITDAFGQETAIKFEKIAVTEIKDESIFKLDFDEDTDVIDQRSSTKKAIKAS